MLAIIPARAGSKGLYNKNTKLFGGLPLICHSIKAALGSKIIDRVIVSTEDNEIASIAKAYGAEVPFIRPDNLAGDTSMVIDSYLHALDWISKENSILIKSFVALLPTAPLRKSQDIDEAIKIFNNTNADSVISVTEAPIPLEWYLNITKDGLLKNYYQEFNVLKNRQELKKAYIPNGAVYIFKTEVLRLKRQYYTNKTYPYVMPRERSVDIDNLLDFEWAEFLLKKNC